MEVARFRPQWLAASKNTQMWTCPYHLRAVWYDPFPYGPDRACYTVRPGCVACWHCPRCSSRLPVREVLLAKLLHNPLIGKLHPRTWQASTLGKLHPRCLVYLDRAELGKLCLTARTPADYLAIELASLDPAEHGFLDPMTSDWVWRGTAWPLLGL